MTIGMKTREAPTAAASSPACSQVPLTRCRPSLRSPRRRTLWLCRKLSAGAARQRLLSRREGPSPPCEEATTAAHKRRQTGPGRRRGTWPPARCRPSRSRCHRAKTRTSRFWPGHCSSLWTLPLSLPASTRGSLSCSNSSVPDLSSQHDPPAATKPSICLN